jgi:hypothetical protein
MQWMMRMHRVSSSVRFFSIDVCVCVRDEGANRTKMKYYNVLCIFYDFFVVILFFFPFYFLFCVNNNKTGEISFAFNIILRFGFFMTQLDPTLTFQN